MSRAALSLLALGLVACQPARDGGTPSVDLSALQGAMPAGGSIGALFTAPGAQPGEELDPYVDENFIQLLEVATASVKVAVDRLDQPGMQEAILEAWDRGLAVEIVANADYAGKGGYPLLEGAGIPVVYRPSGAGTMDNKYVLVDDFVVWTGGLSPVTDDLLYTNNGNIFLADEELARRYAYDFKQMFLQGTFGADKEALTGMAPANVGGAQATVTFGGSDPHLDLLIGAIEDAERSVVVAARTLDHAGVVNALLQAKASGLMVVVLLDAAGVEGGSVWEEALLDGGVMVVRDGNQNSPAPGVGGTLGHQIALIDGLAGSAGSTLVVGSGAWSQTAMTIDDNNLLLLRDAAIADRYAAELCDQLAIALPHPSRPDATAPAEAFARACSAPAAMVRINEVLSDPIGRDEGKEFIEIVNTGAGAVDLSGWTLGDAANPARHTFAGTILAPGGAVVVFDRGDHRAVPLAINASTGALGLNNNGDTVLLSDATGAVHDQMTYSRSWVGVSTNRSPDGDPAGSWARHDAVDGARARQSPGRRVDGGSW